MSLTPEMKMGSPAVAQVVATWALKVVPAGVPLRVPDMSDMRLFADLFEIACSDGSDSMAVGLRDSLGCFGAGARPVQLRMSPLPRVD